MENGRETKRDKYRFLNTKKDQSIKKREGERE
jgi:hypothetical protein